MGNIKVAQEVHHKFEFYFVALAFTIAGIAIQSGKFSGNKVGDVLEIMSWVCITLSGAIGLWRLQYFPVLYRNYEEIVRKRKCISQCNDDEEYTEDIDELKQQVEDKEGWLKGVEKLNRKKYKFQKIFFLFGMASLILSRAIYQMYGIYW